jgi:hypothetical protein
LKGQSGVLRTLGEAVLKGFDGILALQDFFKLGLKIFGRGTIPDDPIRLGAVAAQEHYRRGGPDGVFLEGFVADFFVAVGFEEDKILFEERTELGVGVELLNQQFTASSAAAVEVDENQLVLDLGLGDGLIQGALEPGFGGGEGGENKYESQGEGFFHGHLGRNIFRDAKESQT